MDGPRRGSRNFRQARLPVGPAVDIAVRIPDRFSGNQFLRPLQRPSHERVFVHSLQVRLHRTGMGVAVRQRPEALRRVAR